MIEMILYESHYTYPHCIDDVANMEPTKPYHEFPGWTHRASLSKELPSDAPQGDNRFARVTGTDDLEPTSKRKETNKLIEEEKDNIRTTPDSAPGNPGLAA